MLYNIFLALNNHTHTQTHTHTQDQSYNTVHCFLRFTTNKHIQTIYLHNQEVRIVDIQLYRAKQILHSRWRSIATINKVFVTSSNHNLTWNCNLIMGIITKRALLPVTVIKCNGHCRFGNTSLSTFIDKLLQTTSTNLYNIYTPSMYQKKNNNGSVSLRMIEILETINLSRNKDGLVLLYLRPLYNDPKQYYSQLEFKRTHTLHALSMPF